MTKSLCYKHLKVSNFGNITIIWGSRCLQAINLPGSKGILPNKPGFKIQPQKTCPFEKKIIGYLKGTTKRLDIRFDVSRLTPFQQIVLKTLKKIPYGKVRTYQWLAKTIGRPRSVRAVGNALHINPIPLVLPCHRIIKSDGAIGGFACGSKMKRMLLKLEAKE